MASDLLLLACRIGLLVALALAAAGPLLGRGGAGDHRPTDVAIVIDNSASTGRIVDDRPLFEHLLEQARASLANARPDDRVWIFPAIGSPVAAGVGAARAAEALAGIELSDGGADLGAAVVRASSALPADEDREREVQLISDLQRDAFAGGADGGDDDAPLVAFRPPEPDEPNAAIADIQLTGGTTVPSGSGHGVIVRVERSGPRPAADSASASSEATVRLQVDGRIAGAARTAWGASGTLGLPALATGTHEGRVEVDPAGARADDTRYFSIHVVSPPAVAFVGPDTSFARVGVETLREAGRLGSGAIAAVVVIEGADAGAVPPTVEGTLVFLPPSDPVDVPAFNQLLAGVDVDWTLAVDAGRGALAIDEPDAAFSFSGISVHRRYLLRPAGGTPASGDSTILRTEDGEAWLVRTSAGTRTALLLGSPLTPEATDLPTHPVVLPFLEALLVHWSHLSGWPASDFDAGAPIRLPEWARTVTSPAGAAASVEGGGSYTPDRAGVYRVDGADPIAGERSAHFAVNVPETEIDPTPITDDELAELFPGREVSTGGPNRAGWESAIFRARRGRDAAPWLLGITLALAVLELFLATPGRARTATAERRWGRGDPDAEARTGTT